MPPTPTAPSRIRTPSTMKRILAPDLLWTAGGTATGWKTGAAWVVRFCDCSGPPLIATPHTVQNCPLTEAPQFEQKLAIFTSLSARARSHTACASILPIVCVGVEHFPFAIQRQTDNGFSFGRL